MNSVFKRYWAVSLPLAALLLMVAIILVISLRQNGGHLVYAVDDAYIHMAMAKNFSQHGVWGVTRYQFSSSTSSLLWTLLLSSVYKLFGVNEIAPIILNILFATLVLFLAYTILNSFGLSNTYSSIIISALIFFTPLPALIFTGMEHIAQLFFDMAFVFLAAKTLSSNNNNVSKISYIYLLILSALVTMIRYEGMFLVLALSFLFLIRKRLGFGLMIGIAGFLPIFIYGIISMSHGWYFLPNSVILKGDVMNILSFKGIMKIFLRAVNIPLAPKHVYFLILGSSMLFVLNLKKYGSFWRIDSLLLTIFVIVALLHTQFASFGWFYRYEAYLMGIGIIVVSLGILDQMGNKIALPDLSASRLPYYLGLLIFVILALAPIGKWGFKSLYQTPQAMHARFLQHIQPALFLSEYYDGEVVVANDVGAINYFADIRNLDMYGLASMEVARYRREDLYTKDNIFDWCRKNHARIAILLVDWDVIKPRIPDEWIKVGEWEIPKNVLFKFSKVGFYAAEPREKYKLMKSLRDFSKKVPQDIKQSGEYLHGANLWTK